MYQFKILLRQFATQSMFITPVPVASCSSHKPYCENIISSAYLLSRFSLSVHPSTHSFMHTYIYLSNLFVHLCISVSLYLFISLCLSLPLETIFSSLSVHPQVYLFLYLYICVCLSVRLVTRISFVCLFVCLHLSV
jgi:hypothetical protein